MNVRLTNNDYAKYLQKEEDRQLQLINTVFNTNYKKSKYVVQALDEELKNYDSILSSVEYSRYHANMEILSKELATLKSGLNGECLHF